jgi:hypothetical protein
MVADRGRARRDAEETRAFRSLLHAGWIAPLAALLMLIAYASQYGTRRFLPAAATSVLTGFAALVIGALLGFLFGIPRALQRSAPGSADEPGNATRYAVNTNLEQISDWLTKILVGLGLIQLGRIGTQFGRLSARVGASIGPGPSGQLVAGADMVFFAVWGFLAGYLLTRTYLTAAFRVFDQVGRVAAQAARQAATEVRKTAEEQKREQDHIDVEAISLASQLLAISSGDEPSLEQERVQSLEELLARASPPILEQIYQRARSQRSAHWDWRDSDRAEVSRLLHERAVPVLRALVAVEPGDRRFHADLGYALKDKAEPDYDGAIRELGVAIDLARQQGDGLAAAWGTANRAQARISRGYESDPPRWPDRAAIWDDIHRAEEYGGSPRRMVHDPPFDRWRADNSAAPGGG